MGTRTRARNLAVAYERFYDYLGTEVDTFLPGTGPGPRKRYYDVMYDYLFYVDPRDWTLRAGLCDEWSVSENALVWRMRIRSGVGWHRGLGPVTAADAAATIRSIGATGSASPAAPFIREVIADATTDGEDCLQLQLRRPYPALAVELSNYGWIPIAPLDPGRHIDTAALEERPVGSGPFEFASHVPRKAIGFERARTGHWRVQAQLDSISFVAIADEGERLNGLRAGEYDICALEAATDRDLPAGARIVSVDDASGLVLFFGTRATDGTMPAAGRWADPRARLAANLAIDRAALGAALPSGIARPAVFSHTLPAVTPAPRYDPAEARRLLEACGWDRADPIEIASFPMAGAPEFPLVIESVAAQLRRIGLAVVVRRVMWADFQTQLQEGLETDALWAQRFPAYFDPEPSLRLFYLSGRSRYPAFRSRWLDELILARLPRARTMDSKSDLYAELSRFAARESVCLPLVTVGARFAVGSDIRRWEPLRGRYPVNYEYVTRSGRSSS